MGPLGRSKIVQRWKHENQKPGGYVISSAARQRYFTHYVPLHRAALTGDWKTAEKLLRKDSTLATARITEGGETALHIAAVEGHAYFVAKLLEKMEKSDLKIQNEKQCTALCFAAAGGHVDIAKLMVEMNLKLPTIGGEKWVTPLYMAVLQGYKEMAEYLFPLSDFQSWTIEEQTELLTTSIHSGLYDLAVSILNQYKMLAVVEDNNGETALEVLASKPLAFCGTNQQRLWGNIASTMLSYIKSKARNASTTCDAYTLLDCLWESIVGQEDVETAQFPGHITKSLFVAAESGNEDFLVELIGRYPDFIYKVNNCKHSIFHIAVSQRYVKVFNLIYELRGVKDLILSYIDKDGNSILHLAAKLAPSYQLNHIPGAALQMQQELLWYKEVEKIVQPSYRNLKNSDGQTPYDLFLVEHKNLMKEGEKQMKQSAKSLMLLTVLIATLVFASAFMVPDVYSNMALVPQNKKLSKVFPISEAIATLASLTSMLMFLLALTSHYSENNFVRLMALSLGVGVAALFVSIVAMMVVFCSYLLLYGHGLPTLTVFLVLFSCVPIMFAGLMCPLLFNIVRCTYSPRWLFGSDSQYY